MNSDGAAVCDSSELKAYIIQYAIAELPAVDRVARSTLSTIWIGSRMPHRKILWKPFLDEIRELQTVGFEWRRGGMRMRSRVFVTTCVVDSPERYQLVRINSFNGLYGCIYCTKQSATHFPNQAHRNVHSQIYRYQEDEILRMRTDKDILSLAKEQLRIRSKTVRSLMQKG